MTVLTCDAWHITSPAEDGSGAAKAMELAVRESGLSKRDIGYINAHGTSTHHNDLFETRAIRNVFGTHADDLIVKFDQVDDRDICWAPPARWN